MTDLLTPPKPRPTPWVAERTIVRDANGVAVAGCVDEATAQRIAEAINREGA